MADHGKIQLERLEGELTKLALEYCQQSETEAFVVPTGSGQACVAYGSREQLTALLNDRLTPYAGND